MNKDKDKEMNKDKDKEMNKDKEMIHDIFKEIEKQSNAERNEALTKALFYNGWSQKSHFNAGPYCTVQEFAMKDSNVIILLSQDTEHDKYKIEIQIGDYMGICYELRNTTTPFHAHDRHIQFFRGDATQFYNKAIYTELMTFDLQTCHLTFLHKEIDQA